jgi:hypothetical protein
VGTPGRRGTPSTSPIGTADELPPPRGPPTPIGQVGTLRLAPSRA